MKRISLVLIFTFALLFTLAAGVAFALPASITDFTGDAALDGAADQDNGFGAATGSGTRLTTDNGTGAAEHSNSTDAPANSSYGPHGKYTTDTNACGRCHQLHQAKAERLFRFDFATTSATVNNPIYGICTYCHRFNGQSTYDVVDGMIWDTANGIRYAANGGGFERMVVVEGPASVATVVKASSSHQVNRSKNGANYVKYSAPGGPAGDHVELKCSSCHNPHGSANARILVENPLFVTGGTLSSIANANFTPLNGANKIPEFVKTRFGDEESVYPTQISKFCGSCHRNYLNESNTGSELSGTNFGQSGMYRHKINMTAGEGFNTNGGTQADGRKNDGSFGYNSNRLQLPLGTTSNDPIGSPGSVDKVVCTTCHFAHGTSAMITKDIIAISGPSSDSEKQRMDNNAIAGQEYYLLKQIGASTHWGETIKNLRMDNRAVCQNCHNRSSVDATQPKLQNVINPSSSDGTKFYNDATIVDTVNVKKATAGGTDYLVIRFDKYMAKSPVETTTNYTFSGGGNTVAKATLMPDGRSVLLTGTFVSTQTLTVNATNVVDINGNQLNASFNTVTIP